MFYKESVMYMSNLARGGSSVKSVYFHFHFTSGVIGYTINTI